MNTELGTGAVQSVEVEAERDTDGWREYLKGS